MDLRDFQQSGRLNLSGFSELNKGIISESEFLEKYVKDGNYEFYTEQAVSKFQSDIKSELIKGEIGSDELKISQRELRSINKISYQSRDGVVSVFVKEKIEKSTEESEDLQKGDVCESFGAYKDNKLSFQKDGKEIKEQIDSILVPLLEAQKIAIANQMKVVLAKVTEEPTMPVPEYLYRGFAKVVSENVKRFDYNLLDTYDNVTMKHSPMTEDQKTYGEYNSLAEKYVSTISDIEYAKMLSRNLSETKKYELTSEQLLALQF